MGVGVSGGVPLYGAVFVHTKGLAHLRVVYVCVCVSVCVFVCVVWVCALSMVYIFVCT